MIVVQTEFDTPLNKVAIKISSYYLHDLYFYVHRILIDSLKLLSTKTG